MQAPGRRRGPPAPSLMGRRVLVDPPRPRGSRQRRRGGDGGGGAFRRRRLEVVFGAEPDRSAPGLSPPSAPESPRPPQRLYRSCLRLLRARPRSTPRPIWHAAVGNEALEECRVWRFDRAPLCLHTAPPTPGAPQGGTGLHWVAAAASGNFATASPAEGSGWCGGGSMPAALFRSRLAGPSQVLHLRAPCGRAERVKPPDGRRPLPGARGCEFLDSDLSPARALGGRAARLDLPHLAAKSSKGPGCQSPLATLSVVEHRARRVRLQRRERLHSGAGPAASVAAMPQARGRVSRPSSRRQKPVRQPARGCLEKCSFGVSIREARPVWNRAQPVDARCTLPPRAAAEKALRVLRELRRVALRQARGRSRRILLDIGRRRSAVSNGSTSRNHSSSRLTLGHRGCFLE